MARAQAAVRPAAGGPPGAVQHPIHLCQAGMWLQADDYARRFPSLAAAADFAKDLACGSNADSTSKRYLGVFRQFVRFCREHNIPSAEILPAAPTLVAFYFTHLSSRDLSTSSLRISCAAITWVHRVSGFPSPCDDPTLRAVVAGAERLAARPVQSSNPLPPALLQGVLLRLLAEGSVRALRLAAMMKVCFGAFLRVSELVELQWCDLTVPRPDVLSVFIPWRKNDQQAQGESRVVPGSLDDVTSALSLMRLYSQAVQPEFPSVDRRSVWPAQAPLRGFDWSRAVSLTALYDELRFAIDAVGADGASYSWHSLRAGAATSAANRGVPEDLLMAAGGWRSASAARMYVHHSESRLLEASALAMAPGGRSMSPPQVPSQRRRDPEARVAARQRVRGRHGRGAVAHRDSF